MKARETLFSAEEEMLLVGWIIYQDLAMQSSTTEKFREFVCYYFGKFLNSSYISKFMNRHFLSLKLVGNASSKETARREEIIQETVDWLESLDQFTTQYNISAAQIKAIDKTYLCTAPWHKYVRHIGPTGSIKSRKVTSDRGVAHEIWTTLAADGRSGPFFVRTKEMKLVERNIFGLNDNGHICYVPPLIDPKSRKNISPGERSTLAYLRYMIYDSKFIERGDVIIIDAEGALCTDGVQEYLVRHGVFPFVLPSALHQLLNPCDNSFHSIFKQRYYRLISNKIDGNIDVKKKLNLALKCYHQISADTVSAMFRRCGLVPTVETKRSVVTGLMCEGITSLDKNNQHHKKCLLSYLKWCKANNLLQELCPFRINVSDLS
jgi:hypothetical protein